MQVNLKITEENKKILRILAVNNYGKDSISLLINQILEDYLNNKEEFNLLNLTDEQIQNKTKIEIRVPKAIKNKLIELAGQRLMSVNSYVVNIILNELTSQRKLFNDEIQVLTKSNYELSKIGTNLNQIARAFNIVINNQNYASIPKLGRRIDSLRNDIKNHTKLVLKFLDLGIIEKNSLDKIKIDKSKEIKKSKINKNNIKK